MITGVLCCQELDTPIFKENILLNPDFEKVEVNAIDTNRIRDENLKFKNWYPLQIVTQILTYAGISINIETKLRYLLHYQAKILLVLFQ